MTATEALLGTFVVLALVAVVGLLVFKQRAKVRIKGPGKIVLDIDGSNDPAPAIRAEGVKSHAGGVVADDGTGRGLDVKNIEAKEDVRLSSKANDPKA